MDKLDLKEVALPLNNKSFKLIRGAIRNGKIKWMDMSQDLMYAYQDFWRFDKYKNYQ